MHFSIPKVFTFKSRSEYSNIPATNITIFAEQTNYRPSIDYKANPLPQKLALATNDKDLSLTLPSLLALVPYDMVNSINAALRPMEAIRFPNGADAVLLRVLWWLHRPHSEHYGCVCRRGVRNRRELGELRSHVPVARELAHVREERLVRQEHLRVVVEVDLVRRVDERRSSCHVAHHI